MARKVVGVQHSAFLVILDDAIAPRDARACVVDDGKLVGGSGPLQSFLARGYWEDFTGTESEAAAILKALPAEIPVAIHEGLESSVVGKNGL